MPVDQLVRRGRRAQRQDVFRVDGRKTTGHARVAVNTPLTCRDGLNLQVRAGSGARKFPRIHLRDSACRVDEGDRFRHRPASVPGPA